MLLCIVMVMIVSCLVVLVVIVQVRRWGREDVVELVSSISLTTIRKMVYRRIVPYLSSFLFDLY